MDTLKPVRGNSRESILEAAAIVFSANPGASLAEVTKIAGVGRATLHRYFPSRDTLIHELAKQALDLCDEATAHLWEVPTGRQALEEMFQSIIPLGPRFHFLAQVPASALPPELNARYQRQLEGTAELVAVLKAEGEIATDVPTAWAVSVIDSLIWAGWDALHRGAVARQEIGKLACDTVLRGLAPRPS